MYGDRELELGCTGTDVAELQIRLAGFLGTEPDGHFGEETETQVTTFQQDFMGIEPTGVVDHETMGAIDEFGADYPFNFDDLCCRCGRCAGFGLGYGKDVYQGMTKAEMYHQYEYPGMHRMLLWAVRALFHYMPDYHFRVVSGYRCRFDNQAHGRTSTNHHGKAIDIDLALEPAQGRQSDLRMCNVVRQLLQETANAQIGWKYSNQKSLELSELAPTWVHYDVRSYSPKYLQDSFFCKSLERLNNMQSINF